MKRILIAAALCAAVFRIGASPAPPPNSLANLGSLFDLATGAVRDTNGDGLADSVAARIIVPAEPTIEDVQAATNLAGRLGFETIALTLPLVLKASDVQQPASIALPILVGRGNAFVKQLVDKGAVDVKDLKAGQALVAIVPSPLGGPDGIAIIGGDDEGTLNGATAVSAYLPRLWGATGARIAQADAQTVRFLRSKGITPAGHGLVSMIVDSDRRGLASITARIVVAPGEGARAVTAIAELDALHRRGLEPETLNYTNVGATRVEVWSNGRLAGTGVVRRSGLNGRTLTPPDDLGPGGRGGDGGTGGRGGDTPAPDTGGRGSQPADATASPAGEAQGGGNAAPQAPAKTYDLSQAYSIDGWFGDSFADLIPDRLETSIVVGDPAESLGAVHIATRLGLETTGITLPLARDHRKVTNPTAEPNAILVGRTNALVQQLAKIGKARLDDLEPGAGAIQIVPRAFGQSTATIVAGADGAGTGAAADYLARRLPYLWDVERGAFNLDDLKEQAADVFAARTAGAQASLALGEVEEILKTLQDKKIESLDAKVYLDAANPAFDAFLGRRLKESLKEAAVTVTSQGVTDPVTVFEDAIEIPWEVDEFRAKLQADVLPKVKAGSTVSVEARLSESPQIRKSIADSVRDELIRAGAKDPKVRVLSAYKQGYLWLTEVVVPELKGKGAKSINIRIAANHPDLTKKYRFYEVPSRWLHELYPADEIFERDLAIPKAAFGMELVDEAKEIYALEALNAAGQVIYKAAFSPKVVEREYLDKFPGWSRVKVTTGWIAATVDGQTAVDARIATDPERFWDVYQQKELPKIYDYVMRTTQNRPTSDKQPFHRDLDVEVWMSEPDFRIGVDEEQISSLESLHEDLYFGTLDFFVAIGRTINPTVQARLNAPGKVYPIIHPSRDGKAGQARVLYAGNAAPRARVEIAYTEKGQERPTRLQRDLTRIEGSAPSPLRVVVRPDRVSEIELEMAPRDDREAGRAADLLANLSRLHTAGLYTTELSYAHVERLAFALTLRDARARRIVANTGAAPASNVRTGGATSRGPLVTWDHVISPDESEDLVRRLAAYPAVNAYKAGRSYRGRDISVLELTLPTPSELISVAKYSAYKPTIFITGRQHANEVSSTSHILKLAELLATDAGYTEILKKVNVILHPVENPDGAQMAFDLQKLTPTHMLHAGRYSALGQDVGGGSTLLPESQVRGRIWREWLPDIYLNPHGYPSHEWVQQFAGYVPPGFRSYWSTRGWYTSLSGVRDPREPDLIGATEGLREEIVRAINGNPDVRALNLRSQARYRRWAHGFNPSIFTQEIYRDTAIYFTDPETGEPRGSRRIAAAGRGGRGSMNQYPHVTFNVGMTEAPDETAQGEWLGLVTKAGFSFLMAHVEYLRNGQHTRERIEEAGQRDSVSLTDLRVRPVKPARPGNATMRSEKQ